MTGRWLHGLVALLLLALAGGQPQALAMPAPVIDAPMAATPCHGHGEASDSVDRKAPACCPDGCPGHCMLAAALPPAPPRLPPAPAPAQATAWAPSTLPSLPPGEAERPPRA